jgi:hypothetical protein
MPEPQLPGVSNGRGLVAGGTRAAVDACLRAIERIEQVIEQETQALKGHQTVGLGDFNHRKSHGLLELSRAVRHLNEGDSRQYLAEPLGRLQARLAENSAALLTYLRAVQDVSTLVARTIHDGESDGTYSATVRFPGRSL